MIAMSVIPRKTTLSGKPVAKYTLVVETHEPYLNRTSDKMTHSRTFRSDTYYEVYRGKGVIFKDRIDVQLQALIYHLYKKQGEFRQATIYVNFVPEHIENFQPEVYSREIIPGGEIKCTLAPYASEGLQFVLKKYRLI